MLERRAQPRVRTEFDVRVETLGGRCLDLSTGGMRLKTEWSPPVGVKVQLTLEGVGRGDKRVVGRVTHWYSKDGEVGVRFVKLDRGALGEIRAHLREYRPTRRDETTLERLRGHWAEETDTVDLARPRVAGW